MKNESVERIMLFVRVLLAAILYICIENDEARAGMSYDRFVQHNLSEYYTDGSGFKGKICKQHLDRHSINHKALGVWHNVRSIMKLLR